MPTVDFDAPDDKMIEICMTDLEYDISSHASELAPEKLDITKQLFDDYAKRTIKENENGEQKQSRR
jgi:hypothetical protein